MKTSQVRKMSRTRRADSMQPGDVDSAEPTPRRRSASRNTQPTTDEPLLESIPIVDDTSDTHDRSLDWPTAQYQAHAVPTAGDLAWTVHHRLSGAPGIETLLQDGVAQWSVEARCAETLHTVIQTSTMPATTISLAPRDVGTGTVHLWPGVVTVSECSLDPTGTPWGSEPITLQRGRYLVRGAPMRVEHQGSDPMLFIADPHMEPETAVSIRVEEIGQDSRFVVRARPDRIDRLKYDEPALMSCWATALALLPTHSVFKIEENDAGEVTVPGSLIGDLILRRLQADRPDIDLWDNETAWDPMRAASAFVHLTPTPADSEPE